MIRIAELFLVALSSAAVAAVTGCGEASPRMQDFWHLDLEQGTRDALETGRPMLVVFR